MEITRFRARQFFQHLGRRERQGVVRESVVDVSVRRITAQKGKIFRNVRLFARMEIIRDIACVVQLVQVGKKDPQRLLVGSQPVGVAFGIGKECEPFEAFR